MNNKGRIRAASEQRRPHPLCIYSGPGNNLLFAKIKFLFEEVQYSFVFIQNSMLYERYTSSKWFLFLQTVIIGRARVPTAYPFLEMKKFFFFNIVQNLPKILFLLSVF